MEKAVSERRRLYNGVELPIECYKIKTSQSTVGQMRTPHYHEHIEFLYASGECDVQVWIAGESVDFRTGDMLIISSEVAHTFKNRLPTNCYICIKALPNILFYSESSFFDVKYVMPFFTGAVSGYRYFSAGETRGSEIGAYFENSIREWINKDYGYEISLKSLIYRIFLWAVRKGERIEERRDSSAEQARLIQRAMEYIDRNYATVDAAETAAVINVSYSHFSRLFRSVTGKNFKDYLTLSRIGAAERMLLDTDLPITEVALSCGFATSSHFIERFKRIKGVTPKQYRRIWTED